MLQYNIFINLVNVLMLLHKGAQRHFKRHHFQCAKLQTACQDESQSMKRVTNGQETLPAFFECFVHIFLA